MPLGRPVFWAWSLGGKGDDKIGEVTSAAGTGTLTGIHRRNQDWKPLRISCSGWESMGVGQRKI